MYVKSLGHALSFQSPKSYDLQFIIFTVRIVARISVESLRVQLKLTRERSCPNRSRPTRFSSFGKSIGKVWKSLDNNLSDLRKLCIGSVSTQSDVSELIKMTRRIVVIASQSRI